MIKSSDHNHRSIHTHYKLKRGPPKTIPHHLAALVRLVRFWGDPSSLESIYRLCILEGHKLYNQWQNCLVIRDRE